jgi:hypothetical protein
MDNLIGMLKLCDDINAFGANVCLFFCFLVKKKEMGLYINTYQGRYGDDKITARLNTDSNSTKISKLVAESCDALLNLSSLLEKKINWECLLCIPFQPHHS